MGRRTPRKPLEREVSARREEPKEPTLPATASVPWKVTSQPARFAEKGQDVSRALALACEGSVVRQLSVTATRMTARGGSKRRSAFFPVPGASGGPQLPARRVPPGGSGEGLFPPLPVSGAPWLGTTHGRP